jgi:hypothetical protein
MLKDHMDQVRVRVMETVKPRGWEKARLNRSLHLQKGWPMVILTQKGSHWPRGRVIDLVKY